MADKWKMLGEWVDTCSCDTGCPCFFLSDPTRGYCDDVNVYHITKGNYGSVSLDGLNVVYVLRSPGNMMKGNGTAAIYVDENANSKQRQALETIFKGTAGGAPAFLAGLISTWKGFKYVPVSVNLRQRSVSIPGILEYQLEPTKGGNVKEPIVIQNHAFEPAFGPAQMGIGVKSHYKDYGMEFDNAGKDGNWGSFTFSGP